MPLTEEPNDDNAPAATSSDAQQSHPDGPTRAADTDTVAPADGPDSPGPAGRLELPLGVRMTLISLCVLIAIAGVFLWAIGQLPVIDPTLGKVLRIVILVIVAVSVILFLAGLVDGNPPALRLR